MGLEEKKAINVLVEDLRLIFAKEEITPEEIEDVIRELKSDEVKSYLRNLVSGSKPEAALREAFFAGESVLGKYFAGGIGSSISPEVNLGPGFVDYQISTGSGDRFILLELKSLFDVEVEESKGKRVLKRLRQRPLKWEGHKEQVLKYIQKGGEYIILTNLKEWCFFSKSCSPDRFQPFFSTDLSNFLKDFDLIGNLHEYLERRESESIRGELDKKFFESLEAWVRKLSEVEFNVDDRRKVELIIGMINKFIFIQTLDDYGVINFRWIKTAWDYAEQRWHAKGKLRVLQEFFGEVTKWFFDYYDTELFRENELRYIKQDEKNVDLFYQNLQLVLGLTYWQTPLGGFMGIMQYNFRFIDEDIFGKAYETFLAEERKERGAYYTPKYITQYIVENTVGRYFAELLKKIKKEIKSENFDVVKELSQEFTSINVLDPACGSGSFLVKVIREIKDKYLEFDTLLEEYEKKYRQFFSGTLVRPKEVEEKVDKILDIKRILGTQNKRELISKILVRHLHGVDLDKRALEVAKVNIWLEAIKLAPEEFRIDKLPKETNHVLPNLEMNLQRGDSLIGLPEDLAITILSEKYHIEILKLFELRNQYLENPTKTELINEIEKIKAELREGLDKSFEEYLKQNGLPQKILEKSKPFHWPLEFFWIYFDPEGNILSDERKGFDIVIGNPPYVENKKLDLEIKKYLQESGMFKTAYKLFDYAVPFIEKAILLLRKNGLFGYIVTNKFTVTDYGIKIREILVSNTKLEQILDVSYLPVFRGTAVYPIVLIFVKSSPHEGHKIVIAPRVNSESEIIAKKYKFLEIDQFLISETPGYIFDISGNIILCKKIRSKGIKRLSDVGKIGYRVLKFAGWDELLEYVDQKPQGIYLKFIGCGNIQPYFIDWNSELRLSGKSFKNAYLIKPRGADEEKWKILESPKILIREVGIKLTAAFDKYGEYGNLTGMYALYDLSENFAPEYILALLNSSLLDFYYKSLYGGVHMAGGYLNFHGSYIENLPIYPANSKQQSLFINLVNQISALREASLRFSDLWNEWSCRLKNNELTLQQILISDADLMREGNFGKAWTSKVSFYPDSEEKQLNKNFEGIKVVGDEVKNILKIYGIDKEGKEELIYEMGFNNRNLMLHVYVSLLKTLESRAKTDTLSQLLLKTTVPVIQPNIVEKTPNIMEKVKQEFEKWLNEKRIEGVEPDLVKIDNEIMNLHAKIDALVFRLYELDANEVKVVLDSLRATATYQRKVLDYF